MAKGQAGGGDAAAEGIRQHEIGDVKKHSFQNCFSQKRGIFLHARSA